MPISGSFRDLLWPELAKIDIKEFGLAIPYEEWPVFKKTPKKPVIKALIADCAVIRESDRALLVRVPPIPPRKFHVEFWVPKSQIDKEESEVLKLGDQGFLVIPEWLAKEKGLL